MKKGGRVKYDIIITSFVTHVCNFKIEDSVCVCVLLGSAVACLSAHVWTLTSSSERQTDRERVAMINTHTHTDESWEECNDLKVIWVSKERKEEGGRKGKERKEGYLHLTVLGMAPMNPCLNQPTSHFFVVVVVFCHDWVYCTLLYSLSLIYQWCRRYYKKGT